MLATNKLEYNSAILQDYNVDQERMKGKGVNAYIGNKVTRLKLFLHVDMVPSSPAGVTTRVL